MNKKEFLERHNKNKNRICDKYGVYLYFVAADVININNIEIVCEKLGYNTIRKADIQYLSSDLYFKDQKIGVISGSGFPRIEFFKRKKTHAKKIGKNKLFIKPIEGVHSVLDWHELDGKLHILAGGQIVLHATPDKLSDEICSDLFKQFDDKMIQSMKNQEEKTINKFNAK